MKTFAAGFFSASVLIVFAAWASEPTPLLQCGSELPQGVSYTVTLVGTWDTRTDPISGSLTVTLRDDLTGLEPHPVPAQAQSLVACVQSAMGLPSR